MSTPKPLTFILSDETVNAYGYRVLTAGIELAQFEKNPVMLFNHEEDKVIGRWDNIRVKGGELLADAVFDESDLFAKGIKEKVEGGFIKGASLGFNIKESSDRNLLATQTRPTATKTVAIEASIVAMPGNFNCVYDEQGNRLSLDEAVFSRLSMGKINDQTQTMNKLSAKCQVILSLKADSTETEVSEAIEKLATRAETAEGKLEKLEKANEKANEDRAKKLAQRFIDARIYTAADLEKLTDQCLKSPEFMEDQITKLKGPELPGGNTHQRSPETGEFKLSQEQQGLSFREMEKNHSKTLLKMKKEAPEQYAKLYKDQYGKDPK